ncbi:hypothetical protein [Nocardia aurea]|uniref:hypothetical protein n=1 Tax=Nocardia aurea TaxID=2144174 RepID=UPI0033A49228
MTKGKYAAKAKNRLANLDNEILQEVVAERDSLKHDLDQTRQEIAELTRDVHSTVMRKAGELAAEELDRLRTQLRDLEKSNAELVENLAFETFEFLGKWKSGSSSDASEIDKLAEAFGMGDRVGELFFQGKSVPRHARRTSVKQARRFTSERSQVKSNGGTLITPHVGL